MRSIGVLIWIGIVALLNATPTVQAGQSRYVRVNTVSGGVKLSLAIARRRYTPNTLAPVKVGLKNISRHPLDVVSGCPPSKSPSAIVLDSTGAIVYPPPIPGAFPFLGCFGVHQRTLAPGQSIHRQVRVILRGPRLEAEGSVLSKGTSRIVHRSIHSSPVTVDLGGTEAGPTATITRQWVDAEVTVTSPVAVSGRLHYQYWLHCHDSQEEWTPATNAWLSAVGNTIHLVPPDPSCTTVDAWHVAAGWVGHPVVIISG